MQEMAITIGRTMDEAFAGVLGERKSLNPGNFRE